MYVEVSVEYTEQEIQLWPGSLFRIMRRAKRAALSLFFHGFPREKKPPHIGSHTRVGCLERLSLFVCVCVHACVSQRVFRPRLSTALNVHGTKASPDGSRTRTNNRQLFSNWFRWKSLRVRRGRCGNVCFHRHQNWVPLIVFLIFKNIVPTDQN